MPSAVFELRPEEEWLLGVAPGAVDRAGRIELLRVPHLDGDRRVEFDLVTGQVRARPGRSVARLRVARSRPSGRVGDPPQPQPQIEVDTAKAIRVLKADTRFRLISELP